MVLLTAVNFLWTEHHCSFFFFSHQRSSLWESVYHGLCHCPDSLKPQPNTSLLWGYFRSMLIHVLVPFDVYGLWTEGTWII